MRVTYRVLLDALVAEHAPQGPTEEHLVEELAGILWRKRRLRLAEAAAYRRGLARTIAPYRETVKAALVHLDPKQQFEKVVDAIRATPAETTEGGTGRVSLIRTRIRHHRPDPSAWEGSRR